jgi:hypothetical protein
MYYLTIFNDKLEVKQTLKCESIGLLIRFTRGEPNFAVTSFPFPGVDPDRYIDLE